MQIKMRWYPWENFVWVYVSVAALTKEAASISYILPQKIIKHPAFFRTTMSTDCILICWNTVTHFLHGDIWVKLHNTVVVLHFCVIFYINKSHAVRLESTIQATMFLAAQKFWPKSEIGQIS